MKLILSGIPPSLNKFLSKENSWEYRKQKREWKESVVWQCKALKYKCLEKAKVTVTYYFPDKRRRDPDNFAPKMILDGLTAAGVIADDDFDHIQLTIKKGGIDKGNPRTEIDVI